MKLFVYWALLLSPIYKSSFVAVNPKIDFISIETFYIVLNIYGFDYD